MRRNPGKPREKNNGISVVKKQTMIDEHQSQTMTAYQALVGCLCAFRTIPMTISDVACVNGRAARQSRLTQYVTLEVSGSMQSYVRRRRCNSRNINQLLAARARG